jgi:hypothetical protein
MRGVKVSEVSEVSVCVVWGFCLKGDWEMRNRGVYGVECKTTSISLPVDVLAWLDTEFGNRTRWIVAAVRSDPRYQEWARANGCGGLPVVGVMGAGSLMPPGQGPPEYDAMMPPLAVMRNKMEGASSPKVCQRCGVPEESGTLCFDCAMDGEV